MGKGDFCNVRKVTMYLCVNYIIKIVFLGDGEWVLLSHSVDPADFSTVMEMFCSSHTAATSTNGY